MHKGKAAATHLYSLFISCKKLNEKRVSRLYASLIYMLNLLMHHLYFCPFGLLKIALSIRQPKIAHGLYLAVPEEWAQILLPKLQKVLLSLKLRYIKAFHIKSRQTEHLKLKYFI